jgi:hypothetical protein
MRAGYAAMVIVGVLGVSGCVAADDPVEPIPPVSSSARPSAAPLRMEARRTSVEALRGFRPLAIKFGSANDGYALFVRCDSAAGSAPCEAKLLSTRDVGKTWVERTLPVTRATSWGLGIARKGTAGAHVGIVTWQTTVVVRADPIGWLLSGDGVRFTQLPLSPVPYEAALLRGEFHARCPDGGYATDFCTPEVVRVTRGGTAALPVQPPIPGFISSVKWADDGALWAASFFQDRGYTAVSKDAGATWERLAVPPPRDARPVRWAELFTSYDGTVWLSATPPDAVAEVLIWYYGRGSGGGWAEAIVDLPPVNRPTFVNFGGGGFGISGVAAPESYSVILDSRTFMQNGAGTFDAVPLGLPRGVNLSENLIGGVIMATGEQWGLWPNDVWLGFGQYDSRFWAHVVIDIPR